MTNDILSKFQEILQYLYELFAIVDDSLLSSSLYLFLLTVNTKYSLLRNITLEPYMKESMYSPL